MVVRSLCADYFMEKPLLRATDDEIADRTNTLVWLLGRCAMLGITRVVLPFVDASRINSDGELRDVVTVLKRLVPALEETGVELHLETSLAPRPFAELLARLPDSLVKVNYDSGNSASLGFAPRVEFASYGSRIGSVHIKDRVLGGGTVPLGTGDADLDALFDCLDEVGYRGDFVLQVARGRAGDEVNWAIANCERVVALTRRTRNGGSPSGGQGRPRCRFITRYRSCHGPRLLAEGSRVAITGRDGSALTQARTELEAEFGRERLTAHEGDLRRSGGHQGFVGVPQRSLGPAGLSGRQCRDWAGPDRLGP